MKFSIFRHRAYRLVLLCAFAALGPLRASSVGVVEFCALSSHPCTVEDIELAGKREMLSFREFDNATEGWYCPDTGYEYAGMTSLYMEENENSDSVTAQDMDGYRFLGWYTERTGWVWPSVASATNLLVSSNTLTYSNIVNYDGGIIADLGIKAVVAKYIPVYTITTDVSPSGAGTTTIDGVATTNKTCDEGVSVSLRANANSGYMLEGWYKDDELVSTTNFSFVATSGCAGEYTAGFTGICYCVEFNDNGGEGGTNAVVAQYGSPMPKLVSLPNRYGYDFVGYFGGTAADATKYYDENGASVQNWDRTNGATLYAKWTPQMGELHLKFMEGVSNICYRTGQLDNWTTNSSDTTVQLPVGTKVHAYAIPASGYSVNYHIENQWTNNIPKDGITFAPEAVADCIVSFVDPSGVNAATNVVVAKGGAATAPEWSRVGYALGWDKDFSVVKESLTVNAVWTPNSYTIRFNKNDSAAVGEMDAMFATYDSPTNLSVNAFTRADYKFGGWATSSGGGVVYADGATVSNLTAKAGGTFDLYAVWMVNTYEIRFDKNGGNNGSMNKTNVTCDVEVLLPSNRFTRTGYVFDHWTTTVDGVAKSYDDKATVTNLAAAGGSCTLYATWTPNEYVIAFNANGGTGGAMPAIDATYDVPVALTPNEFTCTGYTFYHWTTTVHGVYADNATVTNLTAMANATNTLYAVWTPNNYTVRFNANGGTGSMANESFVYNKGQELLANGFSRVGYAFAGWAEEADGAAIYADRAMVTNLTAEANATNTLYATWTPNRYTIAFDKNGGTGDMATVSAFYDEEIALTPNEFARTGYTFYHWTTTVDSVATNFANGATVANLTATNNATNTLYAVWTPNSYTIVFDANGGGGEMDAMIATYDLPTNLPVCEFFCPGYSFGGWATNDVGGVVYDVGATVSNLTAGANGTVTLYAVWGPNSYTVRFDAHGGEGMMPITNATYGVGFDLPANTYTRTGYSFVGWVSKSGETYSDGETVSNLTTSGTVDLYAKWDGDRYATNPYSVAADCATSVGNIIALDLAAKTTIGDGSIDAGTEGCDIISNTTDVASNAIDAVSVGTNQCIKLEMQGEKEEYREGKLTLSFAAPCNGSLTFYYKIVCNYDQTEDVFSVYTNGVPITNITVCGISTENPPWEPFRDVSLKTDNVVTLELKADYVGDSYVRIDKITFTAADDAVSHPDPVDGVDNAVVSSVTVSDGEFSLSFTGDPDFNYVLLTNATLTVTNGWAKKETKHGDANVSFSCDIAPGEPQMFYKVETVKWTDW